LYHRTHGRPAQYAKADDPVVAAETREMIRERGSYDYRRVTTVVNQTFDTAYRRRIHRVVDINDVEPAASRKGAVEHRRHLQCSQLTSVAKPKERTVGS